MSDKFDMWNESPRKPGILYGSEPNDFRLRKRVRRFPQAEAFCVWQKAKVATRCFWPDLAAL